MQKAVVYLCFISALQGATVRIAETADGWRILRDGKPFYVKGAVGDAHLDQLRAAGANSVRIGAAGLDRAAENGFMALAGLPLGIQRRGFDYEDPAQLEQQRARIAAIVLQYKDHPALLVWNIGNEPEIRTTEAQRRPMWQEVDRLARLVKELDPNHPVIAVIGGQYKQVLHEVKALCPSLDAIGLNSYQDMLTLPEDVAREGWNRAYLVTEFGPRGHWQVSKTPWKVPIEDTSTEKAAFYEQAYRHAVSGQRQCLGSYVFYWSQKQEKTHTWYGMFLPDGSRTEAIDTMTRLWTGADPPNRCPKVSRIRCTPGGDTPQVHKPGTVLSCSVDASDPENDPLTVTWDLRPDKADDPGVGGDYEPPVAPIVGAVTVKAGRATVQMPETPGNVRLFVYVHDGHGNAATANLPLSVE